MLSLFTGYWQIQTPQARATAGGVVISELSMGSENSASEEFVELYNNSTDPISLNGWGLYYKSSTGKTWTKKATLGASASIPGHSFFVLSTLSVEDATMTSGLAQGAGVVQLRTDSGAVVDLIGWGDADTSSGKPSAVPQAGESLYRQYDDTTKTMVDTGNNLDDFYITANMTPSAIPAVEVVAPDQQTSYPNIRISEVLPNPSSNQSESTDEFIELYNPNNVDVNLSGWLLKDSSGKTFVITNITVPANSFVVFSSAQTKISLNNDGDVVSLYNPANSLVDQSADYGNSIEGLSWALTDGGWDWTVSPTPGTTNSTVYIESVSSTSNATTAKKTTAKKATTAAKPKAAASKVSAAKKASGTGSDSANGTGADGESGWAKYWPWLLIILGTGTIGYGIYEYRPEIITAYHKFRKKF